MISATLTRLLDADKIEILNFVKHAFHRESNLQRAALKVSEEGPDFDTILIAFLKDDLKRLNLNDEEIAVLKERLYHFLIFATRQQQIARALKDPDKAAAILGEKRNYDPAQLPERLLKGHLLFEYNQNTLLWEKQTKQIRTMLTMRHERSFVEMIMGSGKTYFGIPITDFYTADGEWLPVNIWPASMKRTNIDQISVQAENIFDQDVYAFSFSRNEPLTSSQLEGRLLALLKALKEKGQVNMSKEDHQALELIWLEHLKKSRTDKSPEIGKKARLLTEIVRLFRVKGRGIIDEAHEAFRRDKMLNHPIGAKKKLDKTDISVVEQFALALLSPDVVAIFNVRDNLRTLDRDVFENQVRMLIAEHFAAFFNLHDLSFLAYMLDQNIAPPDFVLKHPRFREISVARGLLNVISPATLSGIVSVDFGPSKKGEDKFARPYSGNNTPNEEATIQNPLEACLKTFVQQATKEFTEIEVRQLINLMMARAKNEAAVFNKPLNQTDDYIKLQEWSLDGNDLAAATKKIQGNFKAIFQACALLHRP